MQKIDSKMPQKCSFTDYYIAKDLTKKKDQQQQWNFAPQLNPRHQLKNAFFVTEVECFSSPFLQI